ncbi:FkbM family methyltransferase [Aquabacterium sp. A7-Y]|uniref:FkbM family methyltransferase n=1 Tax=Aquabacterium sp. A7-Y TaxID=1349605 RepID=UPI00223E30B2|nr:FkbM family methyltransferase [Aquabacterium sp. A7-Y]MCW7539025.1 FkbM family methyltransferase [Aquabacterium sp. A7-Y]
MSALKTAVRRVLPKSSLAHLRSSRNALKAGVFGDYLRTLSNSAHKLRLGSDYGGWTVPENTLHAGDVCYCVGCGEDISFDLGLIERFQCEVHGFDPTPRSIAYVRELTRGNPHYTFHDIGIWSSEGVLEFFAPQDSNHVSYSLTNLQHTRQTIEVKTKRLRQVMEENHHERLALLKMNIEGAEIPVLESMLEDGVEVDLLLVEFDEFRFPTDERLAAIRAIVRKLQRNGYGIFWIDNQNFTFVRHGAIPAGVH